MGVCKVRRPSVGLPSEELDLVCRYAELTPWERTPTEKGSGHSQKRVICGCGSFVYASPRGAHGKPFAGVHDKSFPGVSHFPHRHRT